MQKSEEMYKIIYYCDEIGIKPTMCLQPWNCDCSKNIDSKCGYSLGEAKDRIIDYYQKKVEYLKKSTPEEFLKSMGIYCD